MNEMIRKMIDRHSIRRFQDRQLEEETLVQILEAGLYAPSAGNGQTTVIAVCQDKEINTRLGKIGRYMMYKDKAPSAVRHHVSADQPSILDDPDIQDSFYGAPTVLTVFAKNGHYAQQNAAIVAENLLLAAHFLDVGACYIGRSEEVFATETGLNLMKEWNIPENYTAVCNVILGYREGTVPKPKPRKENRIIRV